MDLRLSPAQAALQARALAFCEEVLQPLEQLTDEAGHLPMERRPAVKAAVLEWGLNAINHGPEVGGQGLTMVEQTLVNEQLGRATCGLWTTVWQPAICLKDGTAAQIETYLAPSCRGERRACYAVSEPGAGSDPSMIETRAERAGGGFRLSGEKWFVTSFDASDFMVVQALVDGDTAKPTLFLVARDAPGVTHLRSPRFMHSYAFDHAEIRLEGVEVGTEAVLGAIGGGYELTKDWFVEARLQIAAHCTGAATRAAEIATAHAKKRVQFGRPIGDFQAVEFKLADMAVEIMAAQSLLYRVAAEIDSGAERKRIHAQASALKLFCSEMAGRVIDSAVQVLGGRGYMRESPVERLYRDIRVDRIWEGTSEIQRSIIGRQIKKRGIEVYTALPRDEGQDSN
ncbi:MAG: acyl-CoA dehydrogenase family protein [Rhodospirillales bacterium]|nr:acyl-CoA dehydrogenase family protein [Rhodospirillales bacterium]